MKKAKSDFLPLVTGAVDGRQVLSNIDNLSSIGASLDEFEILDGIREVPLELFTYSPPYSASEEKRIANLAEEIKNSNTISPLIIVEDIDGFYVLEGGHRLDALFILQAKSFPALVVKDLTSLSNLKF